MYDIITVGNPTIDTFLVIPPQDIHSETKNGKRSCDNKNDGG